MSRGAVAEQMIRVGVRSVGIIVLVQMFIGAILALQLAPILESYGQVEKVATVVGIAVVRELGPLITAIVLSGFAGASIAAEFGRDNIRCNAVCPGSIRTQMQEETLSDFARWSGVSLEDAWKDAERCALGRSAEPEEVADAMVYLASPMASYVSGIAMLVAGAANPGV